MSLSVAIVVPAFNEESNLKDTINAIFEANQKFKFTLNILIVNDGSRDRTGQIADQIAEAHENIIVIHNRFNRGLGTSFTMGMLLLKGDYYGSIPGDHQISTDYIESLFGALGRADLILSYPGNIHIRPTHRQTISRLFIFIYNLLFGLDLKYYNGPAFFRLDLLKEFDFPSKFFSYHAESVCRFLRYGYNYIEIPCKLQEREGGESSALKWYNLAGVFMGTAFLFADLCVLRKKMWWGDRAIPEGSMPEGKTSTFKRVKGVRTQSHDKVNL